MADWLFRTMRALLLVAFSSASFGNLSPEKYPVIIHLEPFTDFVPHGASRADHRQKNLIRLQDHAKKTQANLISDLKKKGVGKISSLWFNNTVMASLTENEIQDVKSLPNVIDVAPDRVLTLTESVPLSVGTAQWNLELIEAPRVWLKGYEGQGVVVAIMDSGVDGLHKSLSSQFRGGSNSWFDPFGQHTKTPFDSSGHGTQVTSLIVGGAIPYGSTQTHIGSAPLAKWIAVKIFNDAGRSTVSAIQTGFQWLLDPDGDPRTDDAPDLINMSWGLSSEINKCETEYLPGLKVLAALDIGLVAASGNNGPNENTSISPANYSITNSVGSIDRFSLVNSFSGRGPSTCNGQIYPSFVAPGDTVLAAGLTKSGLSKTATTFVSGTSFATAHVSGAIALLKGAFPTATSQAIENALKETARDLGSVGSDNSYGFGLIKIESAFDRLAQNFPLSNPTLACLEDSDGDKAADCQDGCPVDPKKQEPGFCGCSQSETDSDGDGIPNCIDACPNDPNSTSQPCGNSSPNPTGAAPSTTGSGCSQNEKQNSQFNSSVMTLIALAFAFRYLRRIKSR